MGAGFCSLYRGSLNQGLSDYLYNHFTCYMHIGFIWVHDILTAGVAIDYEKKITVIYETNISLVCTEFFRPSDYDLEILPYF